jgi:hypothetical protein
MEEVLLTHRGKELLPIKEIPDFKKIKDIERRVNKYKTELDPIYESTPGFSSTWRKLDEFLNERKAVAFMGNTGNVSNAWLKCFEIVDYFDLIPESQQLPFVHFDNAAFPGSFILSVHHYVNTLRKHLRGYQWLGSSLLERDSKDFQEKGLVGDDYGLYENYPQNWIMGDTSGDVTDLKTLEELAKHSCDLYTSDLGFDVSSQYNEQERLQFTANLGQIISGLITLNPGGRLITKQYSFFNRETIAMMFIVSSLFEEFHVCKPATSRPRNTETYLVGIRLKKKLTLQSEEIRLLVDVLGPSSKTARKNLSRLHVTTEFVELIHSAAELILNKSATEIKKSISMVKKMLSGEDKGTLPRRFALAKAADKWHQNHLIKPIPDKHKLRMRSVVGTR